LRKIYSLVIVALLLMATSLTFGQATKVSPISFSTKADLGVQCSGGQIHDDGVAENGYGWNASAGNPSAFCTKFIPTVYPYKFTKYCIALTRLATGVANFNFNIVMWKSVNGMPGPILDQTSVTASALPIWPTVSFYDFVLPATWAQVTGTDSVFIGIQYDPTTQTDIFVTADESVTTAMWPGFTTTAAGPWQTPPIASPTYWAGYRAFLQRAEGQAAGPAIIHTPLPNTQNVTGPYVVNATITPAGSSTITSAKVFWSRNNPTVTDSVTMTNSGSNYTGNIPGNGTDATYRYYIKAIESDGLVGVHPSGAPATLNTFTANLIDPTPPVITHTAIPNTPKTNWPIAVTATVTDNLGVDSAWVVWRINSGVNKRFKILNTTGNTYTALFNSVNADVAVGNTIYYKIFAQDNSAQHNRDSSAAYSFLIINQATSCIGNGVVQQGSLSGPFNTYWYGNRTNILWTSAEILANGGAVGSITRIGFDIATVGGQAMTGLTFRFQNTSMTTLAGFTSTGWTTAYSNTYTFPGTGMQYIDLTTPFVWDGTNLLMEICFQNTSYSTATIVNGTTISGMEWTEYHDLSTACSYTGFTTGTGQTARANTCFVIEPLVGINPVGSTLPTVYSLSQNYPNPFNPVTKINFALPKQGFVTLKIYDILGRELRTLVNEVKSAGQFSVDFNASEFASGVYFYRLETNGFSDIKRMMLIK